MSKTWESGAIVHGRATTYYFAEAKGIKRAEVMLASGEIRRSRSAAVVMLRVEPGVRAPVRGPTPAPFGRGCIPAFQPAP